MPTRHGGRGLSRRNREKRKAKGRREARRRRRRRAARAPSRPDRPPFLQIESPIAGLNVEEQREALVSIGRSADEDLLSGLEALLAHLPRFDPHVLLAFVAAYELPAPAAVESLEPNLERFQQHEFELLQALCLRLPLSGFSYDPLAMLTPISATRFEG